MRLIQLCGAMVWDGWFRLEWVFSSPCTFDSLFFFSNEKRAINVYFHPGLSLPASSARGKER